MATISLYPAITLGAGELICGIALTITTQLAYKHGLHIGIQNDTKRQILLNLICLIANISTIISTGFGATLASATASNITVFMSFVLIQYGHVILNHNTIIRVSRMIELFMPNVIINRNLVDMICSFLYFLPPVALIPIYFAFIDKSGTDQPMNRSTWNSNVYKPINIGLIICSEFFAILTDIYFILEVKRNSKISRANIKLSNDIYVSYLLTWFFVIADITLKAIIQSGNFGPLLFDNQISICTLALRARCNLQFGLELKKLTGIKDINRFSPDIAPIKDQPPIIDTRKIEMISILDTRQLNSRLREIDQLANNVSDL